MSLLVRRPQELYRVYDELEYMSGAPGVECLVPDATEAAHRRGGAAAVAAALLVVGGGLVALLIIQKMRVSGAQQVAPIARRLQATAQGRHRAPAAAAHMRRDPARRRGVEGVHSVQRRRSPERGTPRLTASRRVVAAVISQQSRPEAIVPEARRPEFGFER